jgi:NADH:ubiquinone oxidoreductase subunit E
MKDSTNMIAPGNEPIPEFPNVMITELDELINHYRKKPGSTIQVLLCAQEIFGYLPHGILKRIAQGLKICSSEIYSIISFHSLFRTQPRGDHSIRICRGPSCYQNGSQRVLSSIKEALRINVGETTLNNKFSLEKVACLGACKGAPVMVIDRRRHKALNPEKAVSLINRYSTDRSSSSQTKRRGSDAGKEVRDVQVKHGRSRKNQGKTQGRINAKSGRVQG